MLELFNNMDNMFRRMDALMSYPLSAIENRGLKSIIRRPHNLITKKDENGNVISYGIDVVYTPFKRDEVKVEVVRHEGEKCERCWSYHNNLVMFDTNKVCPRCEKVLINGKFF